MNNQSQNIDVASQVIRLLTDLKRWKPEIEAAMQRIDGMHTFDSIVTSVLRGERHFYSFDECFIIMEYVQFPGYSVYHCFLAGGSTSAIIATEPQMMQNAKGAGCKYLSISGRVGWERRLKHEGWRHVLSVLHKEVT